MSEPRANPLVAGRGIIISVVSAVYDLSRGKLKNFLSLPLDEPPNDPIL